MKSRFIVILLISTIILLGCENNIKNTYSEGKTKGAFDTKPFMDVTLKNLNGKDVGIKEFNFLCKGTYINPETGEQIRIDSENNVIRVYIPSCKADYLTGKQISYEYKYDLIGAGKNLVYLYPQNINEVELIVDNQEYSADFLSRFNFYITLYGFGEGRLEVSNHLKGESFISHGTFWAK